jgi:signal peptidase I
MKKEEIIIRTNLIGKKSVFHDKKGKNFFLDAVFLIIEGLIFVWDMGKTLILVIAIAFIIRFYLIQPFYVEGQSMEPSFNNGEYLLIDEISYHFRSPQRGEVIVFRPPINTYQNYIKRIIAIPGEEIKFESQGYTIKDKTDFKLEEPYLTPGIITQGSGTATMGENQFFVMGDNRTASSDSRVFGPVNQRNITGKVWFYIKTTPWKSFDLFGKKITIPKIAKMGKIQKPNYGIDK